MVREVVEVLSPWPGGIYVDATVGPGGHAEEILKLVGSEGRLIGIDRDEEALKMAEERLADERVVLRKGRFSDMREMLVEMGVSGVDGILFDFGLSMLHLRDVERGFSFTSQEPLDMRMDRTQRLTSRDIVNTYSEKDIERILREYGEERLSHRIAKAISRYRAKKMIDTCAELAEIVSSAYGRRGKYHPATKTFQALRIAVNDELNEIKKGLDASLSVLMTGGRLCVISYHSLEDRIVKNFMRDSEKQGMLKVITKKPMTPTYAELRANPSSRSAKLRGAEKI